ncbi:hypothetical protein M885DRAFT_569863 [Pelagophyceae sp. CCMP2097]|nr:hypothetical protein M885DRAFT_569863 [Pelagophyceae sp. CCMP2097]
MEAVATGQVEKTEAALEKLFAQNGAATLALAVKLREKIERAVPEGIAAAGVGSAIDATREGVASVGAAVDATREDVERAFLEAIAADGSKMREEIAELTILVEALHAPPAVAPPAVVARLQPPPPPSRYAQGCAAIKKASAAAGPAVVAPPAVVARPKLPPPPRNMPVAPRCGANTEEAGPAAASASASRPSRAFTPVNAPRPPPAKAAAVGLRPSGEPAAQPPVNRLAAFVLAVPPR